MWNSADIVALILLLAGTVVGYRRRLSGELSGAVGMVAAFGAGLLARRPLGIFLLENSRMSPAAAQGAAFFLAIVLALLAMAAVRLLLRKIMRVAFEEPFDKTGGAVAGFMKTALFLAIVFLLANMTPYEGLHRLLGEPSFLGRIALRFTPELEEKIRAVSAGETDE